MRALLVLAVVLGGCGPLLYEGVHDLEVTPIEVRLVRITTKGLEPGALQVARGEGGLAFVNDTGEPVVVVFPMKALPELRCAYTSGFEGDASGTYTRPLARGEVASVCLHEAGTFPIEVRGLAQGPLKATLEVR